MTNKILILSASCINEFASDVPQSVFFSIDTSLAKRIRELAAYVKENDLYAAEFSSMTATGPKHWKRTLRFSCRRLRLLKVTAADGKRCSGT